jgi:tripartite-type tricarboxylate transporter receptor subunit TctC
MTRRSLFAVLAGLVLTSAAPAQQFPAKPVTLIVPWPAGGTTDIVMRALAEATGKYLTQPVIVENKPGASGTLGVGAMLNAKPDGYTITQMPITVFRIPHIEKTPFDPLADVTYILGVSGYTFGVVVRTESPWKTWNEFVSFAKGHPDKISYGTPGANTTLHITMEEIAYRQGIKWVHVPHKGNAPLMQALLGGHIDAVADSTGWGPHVKAGKLRLLVTWGEKRSKGWPDAPTLKELGYDFVSNSPYGLAGPKGMDPKVVKILHDAFKKGMEDPAHVSVLEKYDQELWYRSTADYARYARDTFTAERATMERLKATQK